MSGKSVPLHNRKLPNQNLIAVDTPKNSNGRSPNEEVAKSAAPAQEDVKSKVAFNRDMKEKLDDGEWDEVGRIDQNFDVESAKKVNIENLLFDVEEDDDPY